MMVEYGEHFWRDGWGPLYSVFGGNPLAAMPSLHFATSLMAALLLAEVGPLAGALGFAYTVDARLRARVPRRALRRGSARGRGADGGGAAAGPRGPRRWPARRARGRRAWRRSHTSDERGRRRERSRSARRRRLERARSRAAGGRRRRTRTRCRACGSRAGRSIAFGAVRPRGRRLPLLRAAEARRRRHDACTASSGGNSWWIAIGVVLELLSFGGYMVLFRTVFVRGRRPDRLARELRDHDGRARRDAAVRRGRRGRHRAHRVGAAPLGDGAAARRLPHGRVHWCCCTSSTPARC